MCKEDKIKINELNATISELRETIDFVNEERAQLESKLYHCKLALDSANEKKSNLRKQIEDLQGANKELMTRIGELTNSSHHSSSISPSQ